LATLASCPAHDVRSQRIVNFKKTGCLDSLHFGTYAFTKSGGFLIARKIKEDASKGTASSGDVDSNGC
jgi:hypothetical protein